MTLPFGFSLHVDLHGQALIFFLSWIVLILLIMLATYTRGKARTISTGQLSSIRFLRIAALTLLLLLLFDPVISLKRKTETPKKIAVLLDASASMQHAWETDQETLRATIDEITAKARADHDVDLWSIAGKQLDAAPDNFDLPQTIFDWRPEKGKRPTDLENVYEAAFLVSDGHLNGGRSPLDEPWTKTLPIFPVLPFPPKATQSLEVLQSSWMIDPDGQTQIILKFRQVGLDGERLELSLASDGRHRVFGETLNGAFSEMRVPLERNAQLDTRVALSIKVPGRRLELSETLFIPAEAPRERVLLITQSLNTLHKFLLLNLPDSLFQVDRVVGTLDSVSAEISAPENYDLIILNRPPRGAFGAELLPVVTKAMEAGCPVIVFTDADDAPDPAWMNALELTRNERGVRPGTYSLQWMAGIESHAFYIGLQGQGRRPSDLIKLPPVGVSQEMVHGPGDALWIVANQTPVLTLSNDPPLAVFGAKGHWQHFFHPDARMYYETVWSYLLQYLKEIRTFKPVSLHASQNYGSTGSYLPLEIQVNDLGGARVANADVRLRQISPSGRNIELDVEVRAMGEYSGLVQTQTPGEQMIIAEAYRFGELWGADTSMIELMAFSGEDQVLGIDESFLTRLAAISGGRLVRWEQDDFPEIPLGTFSSEYDYQWQGLQKMDWFLLLILIITVEWIMRRRSGLL